MSLVKFFEDYARFLYHAIMKVVKPYSRCDIVTERYFLESVKESVQDIRSSDVLVFPFNGSTRVPENFETCFLTHVTNKTNLNEYLAQKFLKHHDNDNHMIYVLTIMTQSFQTITMF